MILLLLIVIAFAALCYFKVIKPLKYWQEKGVVCKPPLPFFGNIASVFLGLKSMQDVVVEVYNRFPNHRYIGFYELGNPGLIIRDLELIKQITIKNFDVFPDHRRMVPSNIDSLWDKNVFQMSVNDGWHSTRSTITPTFTSSKMKTIFVFMQECSKQFIEHFKSQNTTVSLNVKDAVTKFSNDVISTTVFGIECDSLKTPNNEFYLMGKEAANLNLFKLLGYTISPRLMKLLSVKFFPKRVSTFFSKIIKATLDYRRANHVVRLDMIHLMMEAQKTDSKGIELTDENITALALGFYFAGFETVSSGITFLLYDIAINPDVQKKLYDEITEMTDGKEVTYTTLFSMEYLDCVVSESLRLHLNLPILDRVCVKPYTIEPIHPSEKPIYIDKGTVILIPVSIIHRDEKYFPNPNKFNPERFNAKNKPNILPCSYLPFGSGPRSCIGIRYALMEMKLLIVSLLQNFEIVPNDKTQIPLKLSKTNFSTVPKEGVWVSLKPRLS